jgi:hypothetical protein
VIWDEGEDQILVDFENGEVVGKRMAFVKGVRETIRRYAKEAAEKIGVKWD